MDHKKSMSSAETEIKFSPITEGLGFHPFSDGLPYAPVAKGPRINPSFENSLPGNLGVGAQAAGPPQFANRSNMVWPTQPVPPIAVPTVKRTVANLPSTPGAVMSKLQSPSLAPMTPIMNGVFDFGYLWRRIFAYNFDTLMGFLIFASALVAVITREDFNLDVLLNSSVVILLALAFVAANWFLIAGQEVLLKTTVGKRIFGLALQGSGTQRFLRAFFFIPSSLFFGLGLLFAVFDQRKRCWHDRLVNLQPIDRSRV